MDWSVQNERLAAVLGGLVTEKGTRTYRIGSLRQLEKAPQVLWAGYTALRWRIAIVTSSCGVERGQVPGAYYSGSQQ